MNTLEWSDRIDAEATALITGMTIVFVIAVILF